jgi:hypothetical protein
MTRHRICNVATVLCINRCVSLTYMYQIYVAYSRHCVPEEHGTWCSLLISNVVLDSTPLILGNAIFRHTYWTFHNATCECVCVCVCVCECVRVRVRVEK